MKAMLIFFITVFFYPTLFAQSNRHLKNCTLLPVTDNVSGALSLKIFDQIDKELKGSNWCSYRSNSGILSIFSSYRDKVSEYLDKEELLKVVASKLDVGSIIRLAVETRVGGVAVRMVVYVNDGADVYFDEQALLQTDDLVGVIEQIKKWLVEYDKQLPYDALMLGNLGEQVTFDTARTTGIKINQEFTVKRMVRSKKHPLLNKIVEWETLPIAKGKIFNVSDGQAIGVIKMLLSESNVKKGDWVRIERQNYSLDENLTADELQKNDFGKLGIAGFMLQTGNMNASTVHGTTSKFEGLISGLTLYSDLWITRNYFAGGYLSRTLGNLDKANDTTDSSNLSITPSIFKIYGGYKFLPLGFFWGPQVDFYGGYAQYSYNTEYSLTDRIGDGSFGGIMTGARVSMPVTKKIRGEVKAEILLLADYKDGDSLYTNEQSVSSFYFSVAGNYEWTPILGIAGEMEVVGNKAKFSSETAKEIQYQNTQFKVGITYLY
jgi:hypothetical protein